MQRWHGRLRSHWDMVSAELNGYDDDAHLAFGRVAI